MKAQIDGEYIKRFLFYTPHDKQFMFHSAGKEANERGFFAGNGVGKTYMGCVEDAMHLTGNYPHWWQGHRFDRPILAWLASTNYEITRDVLQRYLIGSVDTAYTNGFIRKEDIVKKHSLPMVSNAISYAHIKHSSGGVSIVHFKSIKQGREQFQAQNVDLVHIDEEAPIDVYKECIARLRDTGKGQGKMILTMTPLKGRTETIMHFLANETVGDDTTINPPESIVNGKFYMHACWDDNPHLTEKTKTWMRSTYKPYELEAREKGIAMMGTGLVYQIPEKEFLLPMNEIFEIPSHWAKVYGMDVGFFAPTAVVFLAIDRDNDIIYVYAEYSANHLTAQQHAGNLLPMGCSWMSGVCDPAVNQGSQRDGARLLDDYRQVGFKIVQGKYAKWHAIDSVYERIRTGRFKVFPTCRKFMDEWRMYSRNDKGEIIKGNDHLMNALEFVMLDGLPLARTKTSASFQNRVAMF